jgi:16S rRNA (cytosine967-C5)-methyltransferase
VPRARGITDPARLAALDVVLAVDTDAAYANLLLPRLLRDRNVTGRDAALATEIGYGTLRWQGVLDEVVAAAAGRPVARLDPAVRAAIRVGSYQLLHMRVPPHAAVHATVELTRTRAGERPVGLVNAVLRKVAAADWPTWVQRLAPADDLGRLAFTHGYPRWIVAAIAAALDAEDELSAALSEDRPVTHLVARPGRISRDELLADAGPGASAGPWSPYAVRLDGGDPAELAAVRSGAAAVQDEGSQLMALAATTPPTETARWADLCAGPGGKAALLAGLLPAGGTLVAVDVSVHRAGLVAQAVAGRGNVVVADGRRPPWPPGSFDRILVDAPCTGLGALRRRPEVRWRRRPDDVPRMQQLQRELLSSAVESTRPGGVVAYVTCSPHQAETVDVVDQIVQRYPHVQRLDAAAGLPAVPSVRRGSDIQLWPHRHGTDAMFCALLRVDSAAPEQDRP